MIYCPTVGLQYVRDDLEELGMKESAELLQSFIEAFNKLLDENKALRMECGLYTWPSGEPMSPTELADYHDWVAKNTKSL